MTTATFTCPRCLYSAVRAESARFCPRCGLADDKPAAGPTRIPYQGKVIDVWDAIAYGDVANLYRWTSQGHPETGVLKVARTHMGNRHLAHERQVLRQLSNADEGGRFSPFLPRVVDSLTHGPTPTEPARSATMLAYHREISGPDDLYSLEEVGRAYSGGIDARDLAWMWRRLLTILGFVHQQRIVHGCVTPDHVLIEPKDHKVILIGWSGSAWFGNAPQLVPERWKGWSRWAGGAAPATDLSAAARTMQGLLAPHTEPAILRHLERAGEASDFACWKILEDFDRLIEALWGPRVFRPFAMSRQQPLGSEKEEHHG